MTEYTGDNLDGNALVGPTDGAVYYIGGASVTEFATASDQTPDTELGTVRFKVPKTTGTYTRDVPGTTI